jgi:hypothetical protein
MDSFEDGKNQSCGTVWEVYGLPDNDTSVIISYQVLQQPDIASQSHNLKCFGRVLILFNAVCYGTTLCCIYILSFSFHLYPSVSCFIRFLLASFCFLPQFIVVWNILTRINLEQRNKVVWFAVEIGTYQFLGYLGQYQSIFLAHRKHQMLLLLAVYRLLLFLFWIFSLLRQLQTTRTPMSQVLNHLMKTTTID